MLMIRKVRQCHDIVMFLLYKIISLWHFPFSRKTTVGVFDANDIMLNQCIRVISQHIVYLWKLYLYFYNSKWRTNTRFGNENSCVDKRVAQLIMLRSIWHRGTPVVSFCNKLQLNHHWNKWSLIWSWVKLKEDSGMLLRPGIVYLTQRFSLLRNHIDWEIFHFIQKVILPSSMSFMNTALFQAYDSCRRDMDSIHFCWFNINSSLAALYGKPV